VSKVLIWDIETSNLDADFGTLLCVGYKWLGEDEVHLISINDYKSFKHDPTNDKHLVRDFLKVYNEADLTVAYNGILFDRPWLIAKVMEHGLEIPPNIPMQDPYWCVKSNLRISRKSLQNVSYFLRLSAEKTPVEGKIWKRAAVGHEPSLEYIKEHCEADVHVLEEAYLYLRPLMRTHFRLSDDMGKCRYCNSSHIQSRGKQITKNKAPQRRVQCQKCGGWDVRTLKEVDKFIIKEGR
jgi:uncharacterized protein YprB with RNaseH-like and TPR domain